LEFLVVTIHSGSQFSTENVAEIRNLGTSLDFLPDIDLAVFRNEVRNFLREQLPVDLAYRPRMMMSSRHDVIRWQKILTGRGWGAAPLGSRTRRCGLDDPAMPRI
jgi:hypothetical protein